LDIDFGLKGDRVKYIKVEKEFPWERIGCYRRMDPYSIIFCYPINKKPYVLKGSYNSIRKYLEKVTTPTFINETYWKNNISRSYWRFIGMGEKRLFVEKRYKYPDKYQLQTGFKIITFIKGEGKKEVAFFRKLPKAFPRKVKEFIQPSAVQVIIDGVKNIMDKLDISRKNNGYS